MSQGTMSVPKVSTVRHGLQEHSPIWMEMMEKKREEEQFMKS